MQRKTHLDLIHDKVLYEVVISGYTILRITRFDDCVPQQLHFEDLSVEVREKVIQVISDYYQ